MKILEKFKKSLSTLALAALVMQTALMGASPVLAATTTPTITVSGSPATVLSGATTPADFTYTITNTTNTSYSISYWWMSISNIKKTGIKTFNYVNGSTVTPITIPTETCTYFPTTSCRLEIFNLPVNTPTLAVGQTVNFHFQIAFNNVSPTVPETHGIFLGAVNGAMTQFSNSAASFTVNPGVNTTPTISAVADAVVNEDTSTGARAVTVGDGESAATALTLSGTSSNTAVIANSGIVFGGSGANRTVNVTPIANQSGASTITLTVSDGVLTASTSFLVTVNAVNDAPTIPTTLGNRTISEDTSTGAIAFTVTDVETPVGDLSLTGTSSNTAVVANSGIVFGGSGANRTVNVTPLANQFGSSTISVTVSDGLLTATKAFVLTVSAVNDAPTVSAFTNKTVDEDIATGPVDFTVSDVETAAGSLVVTGTSSNLALVANSGIVFGGSGANRTVNITPLLNKSGVTTITVNVSDGALTSSVSFLLNVVPVNDGPVAIADSYVVDEDTILNIPSLGVMLNDFDIDGPILYSIFVTSPAFGTLTATNPGGAFIFTPMSNWSGQDSFTYKINDGFLDSNITTVDITVNPINDAPVAVDDDYTTPMNNELVVDLPGVLLNDFDVEEGPLTAVLGSLPAHGTLSGDLVSSDGSFTYMPNPDYVGSDSFTYYANDSEDSSNLATVTINIVDVTAPTTLISVTGGTVGDNGWYKGETPPNVTLSSESDATIYWQWDSEGWNSGLASQSPTVSEGIRSLEFYSVDAATNEETPHQTFVVKYDGTAPAGSVVINNGDNWTNATGVLLDLLATDDLSGVSKMRIANGSSYQDPIDYVPGQLAWTLPTTEGLKTVRVKYIDAAGNEMDPSVSDQINLDTTAPVIEQYNPVQLEATSASGAIYTYMLPSVTDNLDSSVVVSCSVVSGTLLPLGVTSVDCDASDVAGNPASTMTFDVTVVDTTAPVIALNGSSSVTIEYGQVYNELGATWTDVVDGTGPAVVGGDSLVLVNPGTYYVTYNFTDAAGNEATEVVRTVNVVETNAPIVEITSPTTTLLRGTVDVYGSVQDSFPWRYYAVVENQAGQKVAGPGTVYYSDSFEDRYLFTWDTTILADGAYKIKLEARDIYGNKDTNSSKVLNVVVDNTAPVGFVSYTTTLPTTQNVLATLVSNEDIVVTNNSGNKEYLFTDNGSFTFEFQDAAGNVATVTAAVNWIDRIAPTIPTLVSPINNAKVKGALLVNDWTDSPEADVHHYIYESYNNAAATSLRWNQVINAPISQKSASNVANTTFWWRVKAVDVLGNTSAWSELWKVTVDNTAPVGTLSYSKTTPTNTDVIATLTVNEPVTITNNGGSNTYSFSDNGSFTFQFVDEAGNVGSKTATVANIDKTAPVIDLNGDTLVVVEKGSDYTELATVIDNMDASPALTVLSLPVDTTSVGDTILGYTATDKAGNESVATRTVRVVDTTAPAIIAGLTATPGNATIVLNWANPTDTDFVGVNIYRSTVAGVFGTTPINAALVASGTFTDTNLVNGTTYYYALESVDAQGNASSDTGVSAAPVAPVVAPVALQVATSDVAPTQADEEEEAVLGAQASQTNESNDQDVKGSDDNSDNEQESSFWSTKVMGVKYWLWLVILVAVGLGSYYFFVLKRKR